MRKNCLILGLFVLLLSLFSCKSTTTHIDVLQPADITLPDHVNTVAIMDRSKPESGWANVLEGFLTGEDIFQDQSGRRRAVEGVTQLLTKTPRFRVVNTGIERTGSKGGTQFPMLLEWKEVEDICERYNADALLAIELFDSDSYSSTSQETRKVKDSDGKERTEKYYRADRNIEIKMGWRIYDPKTKSIIDQHITHDATSDSAEGSTKDRARNNLSSPKRVVEDLSFAVGQLYGKRVAPIWITVGRNFYKTVKGGSKEMMEKATRYTKAGEWEKAAETWRFILANSSDPKARGYAAHNMAVANEREGKLESALDWAQKAYLDFGNKRSKSYIQTLQRRISDQKRLDEQMGQNINP